MGRRKREIEKIHCERDRLVTFAKRKGGLMKKAFELSILCDCDVALFIFGPEDTLHEYASSDVNTLLRKYAEMSQHPHEKKDNAMLYKQHFEVSGEADDDSQMQDDDDTPNRATPRRRLRTARGAALDASAPKMIPHSPSSQRLAELPMQERIAALNQVPLTPRRERAFATAMAEFENLYTELLALKRVKADEEAPGPSVKQAGGPLSILVPQSEYEPIQMESAKPSWNGGHLDEQACLALGLASPGAFDPNMSGRMRLSHDGLLHAAAGLLSPMGELGENIFEDLVVTGRAIASELAAAPDAFTPKLGRFSDLAPFFTPREGEHVEEETLAEHQGEEGGAAGLLDGGGQDEPPPSDEHEGDSDCKPESPQAHHLELSEARAGDSGRRAQPGA